MTEWADETGVVARGSIAKPEQDVDAPESELAGCASSSDESTPSELDAPSPVEQQPVGEPHAGLDASGVFEAARSGLRHEADDASEAPESSEDVRVDGIWREWLSALANDSEAAMAAAMTYRQFSDDVRDEWVSALEADLDRSELSRVAVFAPLLAVETDPCRRLRIAQLLQPGLRDVPPTGGESYSRGRLASGSVVATIVCPLYLDFVQVLACCYVPGERFLWVRHDPIAHRDRCKAMSMGLVGVVLEETPRNVIVDELAQTVVAVHRRGELLPEPLCLFAHLFTPGY